MMEAPVLNSEGVEYYYSMPEKKVLLLGNSALALAEHGSYLGWLESRERLLYGDSAISEVERTDSMGGDIWNLSELLRANDVPLVRVPTRYEFARWTAEQTIDYGRWLNSALTEPDMPLEYQMDRSLLERATLLGLGPSVGRISQRLFDNLSDFYIKIGATGTTRRFGALTQEEARNYIMTVINEYGGIPPREHFDELREADVANPPRSALERVLGRGVIEEATELLSDVNLPGLLSTYRNWGIDYKLASNAKPNQPDMNLARKVGAAPPTWSLYTHYPTYEAYNEDLETIYQEGLEKIKQAFQSGDIPRELLRSVNSEADMITRYVTYGLVRDLLPRLGIQTLVSVGMFNWTEKSLTTYIVGLDPAISEADIKRAANRFAPFKNAWRRDYIESLALDEVVMRMLEEKRGKLDSDRLGRFHDGVAEAIDYLSRKDRIMLSDAYIDDLQRQRKLSRGVHFEYLYGNRKNLRTIVRARIRKQRAKLKNGQLASLRGDSVL